MRCAFVFFALSLAASGPTAAAPQSPVEPRIVYSYIGGPEDIFVADADGSNERAIVVREQRDFQPEWAPDGSHIIFTSVVDGAPVIMRVDPDGANLRQITAPEDAANDAHYSPDGTRLIYFIDRPRARDLHIRDMRTGEVTALTQTPDFDEMSPRWAPDGRRVVFIGKEQIEDAAGDVWILNSATGARHNLTRTPDVDEFHVNWSNDGARVVYVRVVDGAFDIAVREVGTGRERIVASGNGHAVLSPHFSPDDRAVIFTRTDFAEVADGMPAIARVTLRNRREQVLARGTYLTDVAETFDYFREGGGIWMQSNAHHVQGDGSPAAWVQEFNAGPDQESVSVETFNLNDDGTCELAWLTLRRQIPGTTAIRILHVGRDGLMFEGDAQVRANSRTVSTLSGVLPNGTSLTMRDASDLSNHNSYRVDAERWDAAAHAWVALDSVSWVRVSGRSPCSRP